MYPYDYYQQQAQMWPMQPANYTDYSGYANPQQDTSAGVIAAPNSGYQYNSAPYQFADPSTLRPDVAAVVNNPNSGYFTNGQVSAPSIRNWQTSHPLGVIAAMIAAAAGGAALSGGLAAGAGGAGAGTGAGAGSGIGMAAGGGALSSDAALGAAADSGVGAFGAAGAGAAGASALPEILVTGTAPAGITAGQVAAGTAGVGAGAAASSGGGSNSNYANQFQHSVFGDNANQLAADGGIQGGAGTGMAGTAGDTGWLNWLQNNAGTLAGLASGFAGGGTKSQTVTNTNEPPAYLRPYLQNAAQGATSVYNSGGPQYYPGSTLAPQSQATQDALSGIIARAQAGSPLVTGAQNYVQNGLQQPIASNMGSVSNPFSYSAYSGSSTNPYASPIATNGATNPFSSPVATNTAANPYANSVGTNTAANPYANAVGTDTSANPYASAVTAGTQAQNPYASAPNTFGGATNPYLDATFNHALQQAQSGVESQYARAGRNIGASAPVMGDIASQLATSIYAPAYESERNRQLQYQTQLNDIGSGAFENQQGRQLQSGLAAQGIGSTSVENARSRQLQSGLTAQGIGANTYDQQQQQSLQAALQAQGIGANTYDQQNSQALQAALAGQNIGAQGYENARSQQLQAGLAGQNIGANTFDQSQAQQLQAALQGQNIGAQGFENAQQRGLADVTSQRSFMDSLLGYASPLAAQDYANLAQLQGAGANQDLYAQQQIDDARARYDYGQNQPTNNVNTYIQQLGGLAGNYGVQTQSQPLYQNQWASALGNAMLLQQLQNSMGYGNTGGH